MPGGMTSTAKSAPTSWRTAVVTACVFFVVAAATRLVVDRELFAQLHRAALSPHRVTSLEHQRHLLVVALWAGRVAIGVTLVCWLIPARRIVQGYDCGMFRIEPDTVISGFLLSPINVLAPYFHVADVWMAGDPSRPPDAIIDRMRVPLRIKAWWWVFVVSVVVALLGFLFQERYSRGWSAAGLRMEEIVVGGQAVSAALLVWIVVDATRFIAWRASPTGLET
ncbi:MAG: DUF4328 domain-containing protein [Nocardioides sp.]